MNSLTASDDVLANLRFNDLDRHRSDEVMRRKYDLSPKWKAKFAWVQHFIHQLTA